MAKRPATKAKGQGKPRKARAAKVPSANGPVSHDHNKPTPRELTDEQKQKLFFVHQKGYKAALEVKQKADADFKNKCKTIKADGIAVSEIKLSLMEPEKFEARVREDVESYSRVARWLGSPIGTQLQLLDEPDRTPGDDRAYEDGKRAGMRGEDCKAPFAQHLPQANRWREGWHAGQAVVTDRFKETKDEPDRGGDDKDWRDEKMIGEAEEERVTH
jgi:ribosome modulation factor